MLLKSQRHYDASMKGGADYVKLATTVMNGHVPAFARVFAIGEQLVHEV